MDRKGPENCATPPNDKIAGGRNLAGQRPSGVPVWAPWICQGIRRRTARLLAAPLAERGLGCNKVGLWPFPDIPNLSTRHRLLPSQEPGAFQRQA
ncbi:hypothetical protein SJA_C1-10540 [Sphingobium indicum UT26S]|uniref:Uncharacterized protein n=1 Tax=Sphingobium indicum (strain DSM 16413 / CCM 7287 / MTCC 6362 / UT26 / NBRC 101211 / UT26S) TaxID=452662 RepID=D4YZV6_SPHIU|nr:hypothetical protein SJA_C1-10540 [Sphingobium indicum UT26S]